MNDTPLHKISTLVATCTVTLLSTTLAWDGATDAAAWTQLNSELTTKEQELATLVTQAQAQGVNTDYAYVTQVVIDLFQTYAQHDRDNPAVLQAAIDNLWWGANVYPTNYVTEIPFDQIDDCLEIAQEAINELEAQIDGTIQLLPPLDLKNGTVTQGTTHWLLNGSPVFQSAFNFIPDDEPIQEAFGRKGGWYYPLSELKEDGTVHSWGPQTDIDYVTAQNAQFRAPHVSFFGYALAGWMKTLDPDVEVGRRNFIKWDIDNPNILTWCQQYFQESLPLVCAASGNTPRVHLLANEPHMAMREGGWAVNYGISSNTKDKYRDWLITKYNNISQLNAAHGSNHASFDAARDAIPFPMPLSLQGGPEWYDICRFNMDRVNEWFQFLADQTSQNDPAGSPATIKILGGALLDDYRDGGIDVEALANIQGVMGSDFTGGTAGLINTNSGPEELEWRDRYTMAWVQQTMGLDFYKSICPDKPFFDSEWHGFDGKWRDFEMPSEYARAMLWLGFSHGFSMIETWAWSRNSDGSPSGRSDGWLGEILTNPKSLNSYGRTMKELNAHSETVVQFVPSTRQFSIFYTEDSAIQDTTYMSDVRKVYEALKVLNIPVGFTTANEISELTAQHTVIVPRTPYISDATLSSLSAFTGDLILVDSANSLIKTEHGATRSTSGLSAQGNIILNDVFSMADDFDALLSSSAPAPLVTIEITDASGTQPTYGVIVKQAEDSNTGDAIVLLVNVSKDPLTVTLTPPTGSNAFVDEITSQLASNSFVMQPYEVQLLRETAADIMVSELDAEADSFTRGGSYANDNFGSWNQIHCKHAGDDNLYTRHGYLRFDLANLSGEVIQKATLRLKVAAEDGTGDIHTISRVDNDSWSESGITYNNQVSIGQQLDQATQPSAGAWIEFDVTSYIQEELEGDVKASFALSSNGARHVRYHSREASSPLDRPELVVELGLPGLRQGVIREYWTGITGTATSAIPTSSVPNGIDVLSNLQATSWNNPSVSKNWEDNYGQRLTCYLTAPLTGNYTFWISSDDASELSLSTDMNAANTTQIASVPGWTSHLQWTKYPEQKSATVTLQAGDSYYLQVLHKEGIGGDHLAIGWSKPGESTTAPADIIPSNVLSTVPQSSGSQDVGVRIEGESYDAQSGIQVVGGYKVGYIQAGDWVRFDAAEIIGASRFTAALSSATNGGTLSLRIGSPTGPVIGSVTTGNTGGWGTFVERSTSISDTNTLTDLYLVFESSSSNYLFDLDWFRFD